MGKVIAVANQKGGTGKTSCAVHLLHWCSQKGKSLLIDADSQESSTRWLEGQGYNCQVERDPENLFELAIDAAENYQYVIIDCPASLGEVTKAAIYCAELVLVPVQPGVLDVDSASKTFRHIKHAQKVRKDGTPYGLAFINRATKRTRALKEAKEYLRQYTHVGLAKTIIYQRQLIQDAPASRATAFTLDGAAAVEVAELYQSLFKEALPNL
ncbi:MAG: ParA family protein [Prochloraceae cyanobacterium]|nr:ParA family protein [Prochloraceae cyanobacterium]